MLSHRKGFPLQSSQNPCEFPCKTKKDLFVGFFSVHPMFKEDRCKNDRILVAGKT